MHKHKADTMTDAKPGFGPNPKKPSAVNIIWVRIFPLTLLGP